MTGQTEINLDTSVLFNFLYSTVLPDRTDGDAAFEHDKGCREYFESPSILIVAGGKACGEFNGGCQRREVLYQDIIDFMEETGDGVVEYNPLIRDIHTSTNDKRHFRTDVRLAIVDQPAEGQLSTMRRAKQELGKCQSHVIGSLDQTFQQFTHEDLLDAINSVLDIDHDADILVDAVIISRDHSITTLAALDSDITEEEHQKQLATIIENELGTSVELKVIDPRNHSLN